MLENDGNQLSLLFSVKDTGIGISEENIEKLFEGTSFVRVDEEKNRDIEGTGLGLSIASQLLTLMDSKLELNSEYGAGSDFYFILSQKIIDSAPMGAITDKSDIEAGRRKNTFTAPSAKILAVDDTKTNLLVIKGLLTPYSCEVVTCVSGAQCFELCKKNKYDLIFMDHMMPGMDGIETLERLKTESLIDGGTKVVALTANAISGAENLYNEKGFDGYLTKPIDTTELDKCMSCLLPEECIVPIM